MCVTHTKSSATVRTKALAIQVARSHHGHLPRTEDVSLEPFNVAPNASVTALEVAPNLKLSGKNTPRWALPSDSRTCRQHRRRGA